MAEVFDVSKWENRPWFNTGGTRAKKYLQRPDGKNFYFKLSHYKAATSTKPGKDYRYEFYSEIIAYEIGQRLGFNVLRYDIAVYEETVGCVSADMINADKEGLIEGVKYLQGYDNSFNPEQYGGRKNYTFQLIEASLKKYELSRFIPEIVSLIIFDAIIGNGDRHQENWAVIFPFPAAVKQLNFLESLLKGIASLWIFPNLLKKGIAYTFSFFKKHTQQEFYQTKPPFLDKVRFAPFYDSGSSLGRELEETKIGEMLADGKLMTSYIDKGKAEIHWNGNKLSHFELINQLIKTEYREHVYKVINVAKACYDEQFITECVDNIDKDLPSTYAGYRLPRYRKAFIVKLITLRCHKLFSLLS